MDLIGYSLYSTYTLQSGSLGGYCGNIKASLERLSPVSSEVLVWLTGSLFLKRFTIRCSTLTTDVSYRTNELEWEGGAGFSKDKDNVEALILFGYSAGGNLACHVAKALENRGRTVSDILMIDSSRKMNLYVFAPKEIKTVTQQFLNHETIAPYVENVLLRDKVAQKPLGIINMLEIPQTIFS
jgi:hypothetical protein